MLTGERLQAYLRARDQGAIDSLRWALLEKGGNVAAAARSLALSERCIRRWIERLDLTGHVEVSRHRDSNVIAKRAQKTHLAKSHDSSVMAKTARKRGTGR